METCWWAVWPIPPRFVPPRVRSNVKTKTSVSRCVSETPMFSILLDRRLVRRKSRCRRGVVARGTRTSSCLPYIFYFTKKRCVCFFVCVFILKFRRNTKLYTCLLVVKSEVWRRDNKTITNRISLCNIYTYVYLRWVWCLILFLLLYVILLRLVWIKEYVSSSVECFISVAFVVGWSWQLECCLDDSFRRKRVYFAIRKTIS